MIKDPDISKLPIKVQLASDLHLEINKDTPFEEILEPCAPILILAGDVGNPTDLRYSEFLEWCGSKYEKIVLIAGNHEYYSSKSATPLSITKRKDFIRDICEFLGDRFCFLDNTSIQLNEDVIIIGTTLWSHIKPQERFVAEYCLNDFNHIYADDDNLLSVDTYNEMHIKCYEWLRDEIDSHKDKIVIVVTHHLPSFALIADKYRDSPLNSAFASDLDHLYKRDNVKYWFYGHSHSSSDTIEEGCRLVANPHGYSQKENSSYNPKLSIKISNDPYDGKFMIMPLTREDGNTYNHKFRTVDPPDLQDD